MPNFFDFVLSRLASFRYAFRGIGYVIRTQQNAWVHAIATAFVIAFGI